MDKETERKSCINPHIESVWLSTERQTANTAAGDHSIPILAQPYKLLSAPTMVFLSKDHKKVLRMKFPWEQ
jgi:thioredoxin-related protein